MQFPTWRRLQRLSLFCLLFEGLVGCRGIDEVALKGREIEQLKFENSRKRESLIENLSALDQFRELVHDLESESTSLQKQVLDLGTHLRFANEQVSSLTAQRDSLRSKLTESESNSERLQQSIDKVKSFASASAGELADLRLKRQELEELVKNLTQREGSTATENASLSREVEQLRAELVKTRAVVRSFQAGGSPEENGAATPPNDGRVEALERELAGLKGENSSLRRRVESLSAVGSVSTGPQSPSLTPSQGGGSAVSPAEKTSGIGRNNPGGLIQELAALVKERYQTAIRGELRWDSTDLVLTGCVALALLLVVWVGIRWIRMHRLMTQMHLLSARVQELEALGLPAPEPAGGEAPQPVGASRSETGGRARRSSSFRRPGFSAVISNKDYTSKTSVREPAEVEAEEPAQEEEEMEEEVEQVQEVTVERRLGAPRRPSVRSSPEDDPLERILEEPRSLRTPARPSSRQAERAGSTSPATFGLPSLSGGGFSPPPAPVMSNRPALEPRKVIGARSWEQTPEESLEAEDDQANTQIIPRMVDDETRVSPSAPTGGRAPAKEGKAGPLPAVERSGGATPQRPRAPEAGAASGADDDRELLAELKAVINKKFDELMK
jgi:hypothetical protein